MYFKEISKLRFLFKYQGLKGLLKTIIFNFKYINYPQCFHFPVFLSRDTIVRCCHRGFYEGGGKCGELIFKGYEHVSGPRTTLISIRGKIKLKGEGYRSIGPGMTLCVGKNATLEIGKNFAISYNGKLHIYKKLTIGDDNMWSHDIIIRDNDGHQILNQNGEIINSNKPIEIGNNVWLGCRVTILKGVSIPNNTIIGANAIITKCLKDEGCIFIRDGVKIKEGIHWKRDSMEEKK